MRWGEAEGKFDDKWLLKSPEVLVIRVDLAKLSYIVSNLTTENLIVLLSVHFFGFYISAIAVGQILKSAQWHEIEICGMWSQRHLENYILSIFYV